MKTIKLFCLAGLVICLPACQKNFSTMLDDPAPSGETGEVTFYLGGVTSGTRAGSDAFDDDVQSARIAVYNPSGTLVTTGTVTGNSSVTLSVPLGVNGYKAVAIANGNKDPNDYQQDSVFMRQFSSFEDNLAANRDYLEMVGVESNLRFMEQTPYVVRVNRLAAKVEIDQIVHATNNDASISITGIYLINVNTQCNFNKEVPQYEWRQKQAYTSSETNVVKKTADILATPVNIPRDGSYTTPHYFYCYPNLTTTDSSASTWSPRYTRLVVEAKYNGVTCYYPINIVGTNKLLESNKLYKIESLRITGPGSSSPDVPIAKGSIDFSIHVSPWGTGFNNNVTI